LVSGLTVQLNAPVVHPHVAPPGLAVTVYAVIAAPPVLAGAVQLTVACAFPAAPLTPVGAPGRTVNVPLLVPVPPGVVTLTVPVVAPAGTVAVIEVAEFTV
jgi:hypothetical protein